MKDCQLFPVMAHHSPQLTVGLLGGPFLATSVFPLRRLKNLGELIFIYDSGPDYKHMGS